MPDGSPVRGATVVAGASVIGSGDETSGQTQVLTDDRGSFAMTSLSDGPLTVVATHPTLGQSLPQAVGAGESHDFVRFVLSPFSGLEGTVTSAGVPLAGAPVVAFRQSASNGRIVAVTEADGHYHFDQLPAGQWQVQAVVQESPTATVLQVEAATIEDGVRGHLDLDVSMGDASLSTSILEADGALLANGQVYLSTGNISANTGAQLEAALAARGPGQTRMDLIMQGRSVRFTKLNPGLWSLCVIAVRGNLNDPSVVQRVRNNPGALPVQCRTVELPQGEVAVLRWPN